MNTDGTLSEALLSVLRQIQEMVAHDNGAYILHWIDGGQWSKIGCADDSGMIHLINGDLVDVSAFDPGWVKKHVRVFRANKHDWMP